MLAPALIDSTDVRLEDIELRAEQLHEREREAQLELGRAVVLGLPGLMALEDLERTRRDLTGLYAAMRFLESTTVHP